MICVKETPEEEFVREVRCKEKRLSRARRSQGGFWRQIAHVGSLGFVFILPLLGGAALGRVIADRTQRPMLALVFLLLGLAAGAYSSWRLIQQSIREEDE